MYINLFAYFLGRRLTHSTWAKKYIPAAFNIWILEERVQRVRTIFGRQTSLAKIHFIYNLGFHSASDINEPSSIIDAFYALINNTRCTLNTQNINLVKQTEHIYLCSLRVTVLAVCVVCGCVAVGTQQNVFIAIEVIPNSVSFIEHGRKLRGTRWFVWKWKEK